MSLRLIKKALGSPPFFVDYESWVISRGSGAAASGDTAFTQVAAPTYTNGHGSYTYVWTKLSGPGNLEISATNVERPSFRATGVSADPPFPEGQYQVEVTDIVTAKKHIDIVNVLCIWTDLS